MRSGPSVDVEMRRTRGPRSWWIFHNFWDMRKAVSLLIEQYTATYFILAVWCISSFCWCLRNKGYYLGLSAKLNSRASLQFICPSTVLKREPKAVDIMDKFMVLRWVQNWKWQTFPLFSMCKVRGSRILHLYCTTNQHSTTTNSINCDEATFQASRILLSRCRNSIHYHVITWSQHPLSLAEAKQASFHAMIKQCHNTCKRYRMFSCLSHSVVFKSTSMPRHVRSTLTTSYGSRIIRPLWPT